MWGKLCEQRASCFTCATHTCTHRCHSTLSGWTQEFCTMYVPRVVVEVYSNRSAAISFLFYVFPILLNYCERNVCRKKVWQYKNVFYIIILLTMGMEKIPLKACVCTWTPMYLCIYPIWKLYIIHVIRFIISGI